MGVLSLITQSLNSFRYVVELGESAQHLYCPTHTGMIGCLNFMKNNFIIEFRPNWG
jgi:hypothetical protein